MPVNVLSNMLINKVAWVSTVYSPKNAKGRRINRERWGIPIKYEGKTEYYSGGKTYQSDSNHIVILPMGCNYEWQCTSAGHFTILEFECDITNPEPIPFHVKNSEKLLSILKELEIKRNRKAAHVELESIRDAYSVIIYLLRSRAEEYTPVQKLEKISPAVEYMAQNCNKSITNAELAEMCGLSTVYFRKLFTALMGESPISYLHAVRIKKAKELLKTDYGTLTDLALTLGYPSLYDFSRDFKKRVGESPTKYSKR